MIEVNREREASIEHGWLLSVLEYNKDTGIFKWRVDRGRKAKAGQIAGSLHKLTGYYGIKIKGRRYQSHRVAWFYVYGEWPPKYIDHISRDKTDNRIINLRCVSHKENCKNLSLATNNSSGVAGVSWYPRYNKWRSYITVNRKIHHLGFFYLKEDAIKARREAEIKYGFASKRSA